MARLGTWLIQKSRFKRSVWGVFRMNIILATMCVNGRQVDGSNRGLCQKDARRIGQQLRHCRTNTVNWRGWWAQAALMNVGRWLEKEWGTSAPPPAVRSEEGWVGEE